MYATVHFPFRLAKEVNIAHNMITGEPSEAYTEITLKRSKTQWTPEKYAELHQSLRKIIAQKFNCSVDHVIPITGAEYEAETEPDEAESDDESDCDECDE
jgi:hypothetical protein